MIVTASQWSPPSKQECFVGNDELTLVLMAGLPGVGKTKLAYDLKEVLGWKVIDKDWHIMELKDQGLDDYQAAWKAYEQSFEEVRSELLEHHSSVILDSAALHQFILNEVTEIVSDVLLNVRIKVILCVADRALRDERLRTRPYPHPRSTIDLTVDEDEAKLFKHLPPEPKRLTLDMSKPFEENRVKAKEYVLS